MVERNGWVVRGWLGAFLGSLGLILRASLPVVVAAALVAPELLTGRSGRSGR